MLPSSINTCSDSMQPSVHLHQHSAAQPMCAARDDLLQKHEQLRIQYDTLLLQQCDQQLEMTQLRQAHQHACLAAGQGTLVMEELSTHGMPLLLAAAQQLRATAQMHLQQHRERQKINLQVCGAWEHMSRPRSLQLALQSIPLLCCAYISLMLLTRSSMYLTMPPLTLPAPHPACHGPTGLGAAGSSAVSHVPCASGQLCHQPCTALPLNTHAHPGAPRQSPGPGRSMGR